METKKLTMSLTIVCSLSLAVMTYGCGTSSEEGAQPAPGHAEVVSNCSAFAPDPCSIICENGYQIFGGEVTCSCCESESFKGDAGSAAAQPQCFDDDDCMEIVCPFGGLAHATCDDEACVNPPATACPGVECEEDNDCMMMVSCPGGRFAAKTCQNYKCKLPAGACDALPQPEGA